VDPLITQPIVDLCALQPGVAAVYVFGSVARGTAGIDSDIDVAVLFDAAPVPRLDGPRFTFEGDLERVLRRPVDLVVLNDAPVDLRSRVLRDGVLLVDRNRSARIAFEVRTRNEAFDLAPVLAAYRAPRGHRQ
jgi:predicted nucleotidyltransferase